MASTSTSMAMVMSESSENRGPAVADSNMPTAQTTLNLPSWIVLDGPVAILWDIENCPVPNDIRPEDVGGNIRMALRVHPVIRGAVTTFSAYGDFNSFPRRLREGCQRTGVKLIDVPNGRKDAADKAILVDMFLFALDNPPPSSIVLISGDVDFAPALHILGQRGYTIILVIPSGVGVSSALRNAGKFVWDWSSVARGEGFVPTSKAIMPTRGGSADIATYLRACHINDSLDNQNEEEAIIYRGMSQSYYNSRDYYVVSQSLSEYSSNSAMTLPFFPSGTSSQNMLSCSNEVPAGSAYCDDQYHSAMWVQQGDINGLKVQLVKLLEMLGGCMPLTRVPSEYQKIYGRPLYVSEYGVSKLVNLFKKMGDAMAIDGKGQKKFVYLRNSKAVPSAPPLILARKDNRGKETQEDMLENMVGGGSSEEFSDEDRVVVDENSERGNRYRTCNVSAAQREIDDRNLEQFKYELQEILVSYSCRIFLGCFEAIYEQRYKKPLDCRQFGVDQLEDLFTKVRDVVVLHEEPVSKKKFLTAVGG